MTNRKHISLLYQYNEGWIGGTYYILNIIKALNVIQDKDKPFITVYYDQHTPLIEVMDINYPYIEYVSFSFNLGFLAKKINSAYSIVFGKPMFTLKLPGAIIENFYYRTYAVNNSNLKSYYHWHPDFQDLYLPHFFDKKEVKRRKAHYNRLVADNVRIVFSSEAALSDFDKFYPGNTNVKKVLRFVSLQDSNFNAISIKALREKFQITNQYFIVSNQFWPHKNHQLVLEAFTEILKKHPQYQLIFTGKENYDASSATSKYIAGLKQYVRENNLTDKILFLGFIDRNEQLKLMDESVAIIQPSLFEGWSTVVEDAKFLNKCIICSDIPVHREQLPAYNLFFDPNNKQSLIDCVEELLISDTDCKIQYDIQQAASDFAYNFIELF